MVLSGDFWNIFETVLASPRVVRSQESLNPSWPWTILLVFEPFQKPLGDWSFFNNIRMCALLSCLGTHENDDDVGIKYAYT